MILLIACVNVTHLELARSIERQRELAVRTALGSSRWQLRRLVMAESLLISLCGAVLGVLLAGPAVRLLVAMAPGRASARGRDPSEWLGARVYARAFAADYRCVVADSGAQGGEGRSGGGVETGQLTRHGGTQRVGVCETVW